MGVVAADVFHHPDLEGSGAGVGELFDVLRDHARRVVPEVDHGLGLGVLQVRLEPVGGRGRRVDVGHVEHRGHATRGGRDGAVVIVLFVGVARVPEVAMRVDQAGDDGVVAGVDRLSRVHLLLGRHQCHDLLVANRDLAGYPTGRGHDRRRLDDEVVFGHCRSLRLFPAPVTEAWSWSRT